MENEKDEDVWSPVDEVEDEIVGESGLEVDPEDIESDELDLYQDLDLGSFDDDDTRSESGYQAGDHIECFSFLQHQNNFSTCCVMYHVKVHLFLYFLVFESCLYLYQFRNYVFFCVVHTFAPYVSPQP